MIGELNSLGIALKSLDAMKLGTVGVNLGNVEAYRAALKGLSVEQSVFALASKGATEEQIRQILVTDQAKLKDVEAAMAKAGLTTATKALNAEELITLATKKGISDERAKEIASALGLIATEKGQIVSKKQLTVATLQQVGATDAEIKAILGLNAAETANIGITNVLTASFAKLWAVITAHPIGAILTAIGVVAVSAVAAYNKWGDTLENTKEKLSDLKSECQEIVSDLQAVNSELETTQQRLEELEGKDTLTFTEKEEYDNLVKINNELQRKIDLLELEEKNKRKEQNKTFVSAMEKDTEDPFEHEVNPDGKKPTGQYSISDEYLTSETGYIEAQFEIRDQLLDDLANAETEKEKERIQKRIDEINSYLEDKNTEWKTVSDGIDYIKNPTTEDDKAVNEWLDYIADFQDRMAIAMSKDDASSNAQYKTNTFNRVVDNWQFDETVQGLQDLGKEGKVTAEMLNDPKYDEFINKLIFLGVIDSADNLEDVALAFNSVANSAENATDAIGDFTDKTYILPISSTIDQLNTRLKPAMDSLKSTWQDIFTDDELSLDNLDLLSTVNSIKSKLDELNKIDGITVDYSSFENFVRILEDTESTEYDVKQGFNELAKSIVQASVSGIEDFQTLKDVLEDLGVVNNEIVAFQALAQNTDALKASGLDLLNATQSDIEAFASKRVSVENLSEAIIYLTEQQKYLQFQTEINSIQSMDTSQEIANLKNLAKNAGITGDVISDLTELEVIYQNVSSGVYGINTQQVAMAMERAKQLKNKIQEEISKENLKTPEIEFPEVKFEPKVDKSSAKKSADDLEKLTKDYVDAYMNYMEQSLKTGRIDYQTYARDVAKFLKDMYDQGKIAAKDYHDYTKEMLEVQKNAMDSVISAVTNRLDKEIDSYEDQIDEVEKRYQTEIDYLDTVIEYYEEQKKALQDANDELDRQKALEEALYNLEKKQNQRTIGLYTADKGKIYTTDTTAIREAEDDVRKAKLDIEIEKLDKAIEKVKQQQDNLQDAMDKEKEQLQSIIDRLEEYKDQWNSVADEYENVQKEMYAAQILGADWESQILSGRIDKLNTFKNDYLSIQQAIADASLQAAKIAWESANEQIRAAQEAAKGADGNTNDVSSLGFEKELDKNVELTSKFNVTYGTTNPSEFEQKLNDVKKYGSLVVVESKKNNNKTNKLDEYYEKLKRGSKYATGTKNAKRGLNLVGEDGIETYIDNDGNVSLVAEPTLIPMDGGEIVKNESETKSLLDGSNLIPIQTSDLWKKLSVNMSDLSSMIKVKTPDYSRLGEVVSKSQIIEQHNQFNISLPNITDNTKATKLFEELQRLPLDALQYSTKRKK